MLEQEELGAGEVGARGLTTAEVVDQIITSQIRGSCEHWCVRGAVPNVFEHVLRRRQASCVSSCWNHVSTGIDILARRYVIPARGVFLHPWGPFPPINQETFESMRCSQL